MGIERVFTKLLRDEYVNTVTACLVLSVVGTVGCKTPKEVVSELETAKVETTSNIQERTQLDDTTTIHHTVINDTTTITTIIRRMKEEKESSAQSLQEEQREKEVKHLDTITPALLKQIVKGLAVVCIGIALVVVGFFFILIWCLRNPPRGNS